MRTKSPTFVYFWPSILLLALIITGLSIMLWKSGPSRRQANWVSQWREVSHFSIPRRALTAVASPTHLYVIGGVDNQGNYVKDVEFASIEKDGGLGPWKTTSSINQGRFYLASAIVGEYVFILGGGSGPTGDENAPIASVERAHINPDGSLGNWEIVSHTQLPRRGLKTAVVGNHIYAIGGYSGVFLRSTEYATVELDGTLSEWTLDPHEANLDRYIHSVASVKNRIYLLGGHVQNSSQISYGDVESTKITPSGELSSWEIERSKLLQARFIASAFALDHWLYMLGGHNGGTRLKTVEFAQVFNNGHVGNWSMTSSLNTPRSAAATAVSGKFVYVLGGMGDMSALNSVEMATAASSGELGYLAKQ